MGKKQIKTTNSRTVKDFVDNGASENNYRNKPYKDKKHKGRSISMTDEFHLTVKKFADDHPELGGISQMTVRALHEFMEKYKR